MKIVDDNDYFSKSIKESDFKILPLLINYFTINYVSN